MHIVEKSEWQYLTQYWTKLHSTQHHTPGLTSLIEFCNLQFQKHYPTAMVDTEQIMKCTKTNITFTEQKKCMKPTTAGMSRPRAATSVQRRMPFSALQNSKQVEVRFCCFCFPWMSRQGMSIQFSNSPWNLTELHDEKNTMICAQSTTKVVLCYQHISDHSTQTQRSKPSQVNTTDSSTK